MSRPPFPPFTAETAVEKAKLAEDAWNSRDPMRVALAYTEDSRWRNRTELFQGREAIVAFLTRKWTASLTTVSSRRCGPSVTIASPSALPTNGTMIPAAKAGGERIGDWMLFCPEAKDKAKPLACSLEQLLIDAETKRVAYHLAIGYGPRGNLILVVRAPLGIALVRGLEVTFGAQPVQRVPFTTCQTNGCQAVLILSKPLQEEILKVERALIAVYAPDGNPFQAAASLKGLGSAIEALKKRRGPS